MFFCVLINRKIFDLLGGVARRFRVGKLRGRRFLHTHPCGLPTGVGLPHVFYHYGSRTFTAQNIPYEKLMLANERVFYDHVATFATSSPLIHSHNIHLRPRCP